MKKEWADKWVSALRSGEYKQGKGFLNRNDKYCCLGVLCEIAGAKKKKLLEEIYSYDNLTGSLSNFVTEKTGMKDCCGTFPDDSSSLARRNDAGLSFEKIASLIEVHWQEL